MFVAWKRELKLQALESCQERFEQLYTIRPSGADKEDVVEIMVLIGRDACRIRAIRCRLGSRIGWIYTTVQRWAFAAATTARTAARVIRLV